MELFKHNKKGVPPAPAKRQPASTAIPSPAEAPGAEEGGKIQELEKKLKYSEQLKEITNAIHSASDFDTIINLKDDILSLFDADRITIYMNDPAKKEIYSRTMVGNEVQEIRVPINSKSIAGFSAHSMKEVNIKNAYDDAELKQYHGLLEFDRSWDEKTGYRTKQVLAAPILFNGKLFGVIQLINKKSGEAFTDEDLNSVVEIAKILGIAFNNQSKITSRRVGRFDYLIENRYITERELNQAVVMARELNKIVDNILLDEFKVPKKEMLQSLGEFYGCDIYRHEEGKSIPSFLLKGLNLEFLERQRWAPLSEQDGVITIAIDDPKDLIKTDMIRKHYGYHKKTKFMVALGSDILDLIELTRNPPQEEVLESMDDILGSLGAEEATPVEDAEAEDITETDSSIVKLANQIIREAYHKGASDIHVEPYPGKRECEVRIRIDGVCQKYLAVPASYSKPLVSRFKIMSQLDIAEKRKPQDGKIKFRMPNRAIELRVATIPTAGGMEDVVMRILASNEPIPLNKMAFSDRNYSELVNVIQKPYGLILCVGPTGSGKTTTLHSCLGYINKPERKIWTAEDPVEITQIGLRQVQVQPKIGFSFASSMRAFLRADPDVIMVGEMRDEETANIGIEASLTGHLVLSTLHTNSAPETITRLLDMGLDPFNFADALLGILAQRLARTLCSKCKEKYHPEETEYSEMRRMYGEQEFDKLNAPYNKDFMLYRPKGCDTCGDTGYKGRIGLHELLLGSDTLKEMIVRKERIDKLREQAVAEGMTTLLQDGIQKVLQGHTDFKSVRSVCIK